MKRQKAQRSNIGIFGKAVVTATLLGYTAVPQAVHAGQTPDITTNGIYVTILSPTVDVTDPNKPIEISAFYQAATITGGITTLELYVDGQQDAVKKLDTPENRGVVSFVINPGALTPGNHHIVVRVSASDAEIASAKTGINIAQPATESLTPTPSLGGDTSNGAAPAVAIMTPGANATVTGTVDIKVDAHDDSGKSPYVSLFVDHTFKTLRNFPPYDFAWDTTRVPNGYHTIEVWGYNDDQAVGHAQPLTVFVNNPGGRTLVRHDLLDTVPTKVLINETRPKPAAELHKSVALKTSLTLAQGSSAASNKIERLASADVDDNQTALSEEAQLMSPFIPTHAPVIEKSIPAPQVNRAPSLAVRPASASTGAAEQLSQIAQQTPELSAAVMLASPTIEDLTPSMNVTAPAVPVTAVQTPTPTVNKAAPVLAVKPLPTAVPQAAVKPLATIAVKPTPIIAHQAAAAPLPASPVKIAPLVVQHSPASLSVAAIKPVPIEMATANVGPTEVAPIKIAAAHVAQTDIAPTALKPDVAPASREQSRPNLAASVDQPSYMAHLDNATVEMASDQAAADLEQPKVEAIPINVRAALAAGKDIQPSLLGTTKLASASINSSELFMNSATLQTPNVPARQVINFVSSHQVGTRLQPLGSSPAGFAPNSVQRFQLVLNNKVVALNQPLQDKNKFLFAPFRQIFENEGGVMSWDANLKQVHALNGSRDVMVTIGSKTALVNQEPVTMNASPYIVEGHTMIPLAFVPMALDATVSFDPASGHIVINSNQ